MNVIYFLERALVIARKQRRHFLVYLIGLAILEAGGTLGPCANDNRTEQDG